MLQCGIKSSLNIGSVGPVKNLEKTVITPGEKLK